MIYRSLLVAVALSALSALTVSAGAQTSPKWKVDSVADKSGAHAVVLSLRSPLPVDGWPGGFVPVLAVKCTGGEPSVFIVTGLPAKPEEGKEGHFSVLYHFDNGPRIDAAWAESPSSDTLVAPNAREFIHELLQAKRFRFGYTRDHSTLSIQEFLVTGFAAALAKVSSACGSPS
ncbi:MAG TPA: hypothetical protein VGM67_09280 [Gemmatimonadaceae bacterium]|jgi:hypothetical protein